MLGIDDSDAGEVDDVLDFVTALEAVDGLVHTDEHRPDRLRIAQPLEELVADVAGFEVREHEDVRRVVQLRELVCPREHLFDDGGVGLHLTGEEIDGAIATITDDVVALPVGGRPSPTLPENWRTVTRPDRRVFQRADRDHYIVLGEGSDEWLVVLCSQGDRAYPAPLAHRAVAKDADVELVVQELAEENNELLEPPEGEH